MSQSGLEDSKDPWKYMIVLSKFMLLVIDGGIVKSFGVLIPEMVVRYDSDYKTIALICSLPSFMYVAAPLANLLSKVMNPRTMGMVGGILSAVPIMCAPLTDSLYVLGMMFILAGFGMSLTYLPVVTSVNIFFQKSFIFANTLTQFGTTCGAFAVPVIIERCLEAYGYHGAFLILGAIALHAVVSAACLRTPLDLPKDTILPKAEDSELVMETSNELQREHASKSEQGRLLLFEATTRPRDETEHDTDDSSVSNPEKQQTPSMFKRALAAPSSTRQRLKSLTIVREPLFTLVIPAIFLDGYVRNAWMLFLVPHAECNGIIRSKAVFLSTIAGISGILGKIFYLILLHHNFNSILIFSLSCVVCAASFFLDPINSTFTFLAIMSFLQGFIMFIIDCSAPALVKLSVRNGENMQTAISLYIFAQALGAVTGDTTSGHIYDVIPSCSTLFISLGVILVVVSINLLIFFFVDRKRPSSVSTRSEEHSTSQ